MDRPGVLIVFSALAALGLAGCRTCRCTDHLGCLIDHKKDYPVLFDTWYCPRLDISRAGMPDWCGPVNRLVGCRSCDCVPEWTRNDEIWLYPPRHPHWHPGASFPGSSQFSDEPRIPSPTTPAPARIPLEAIPPAPLPEPPGE